MAPHILILGGTTEARELAAELAARQPEIRVTTSLAGRVSRPAALAGDVRIGGSAGPRGWPPGCGSTAWTQ